MAQNQYGNVVTPAPQAVQPGQVSVMLAAPPTVKTSVKYKVLLYKFGITEVVLGSVIGVLWLATIIAAIAAPQRCYDNVYSGRECYSRYFGLTWVSAGAWCGIFLIPTGILGITAKKNSTLCIYNANMAMSIVSAVMMGVLLIMSGIAAAAEGYAVVQMFHGLLAVISLAAMVICIVHSAYCCAGACCLNKRQYGAVAYRPATQPQQYMQLPNGQLVLLQSQPMLQQNHPVMMMTTPGQFQPHQAPATMVQQPNAGTIYPMNVPLGGNMPVTAIPSQPAGAQVLSATQPVVTAQMKEQGGVQSSDSKPPSYREHNS